MPYLILFISGLFVGSFLNVLIDRLPRKETFIKGRSYCESCKKELAWYDLIPVLSFVVLSGKCRYCGKKLSSYYPLIELTTGLMFALVYLFLISNFQFSMFSFSYYLFIASVLIVIFFIDLKYGIIPDKIVFPAIIVGFAYSFIVYRPSFLIYLVSAIGALLFFIIISLVFYALTRKIGFGGGDVKLAFLMGLLLGFPGIVVGLYIAFLTGAVISIILILWRKKRFFKDSIPFGPFLILGTLAALFWGNYLYGFALNILGL